MRRRSKVPIVLVALLFLLAAVAEIATSRIVVTADEASELAASTAGLTLATF
jgi:hypothetical protein